jgi:Tfp pilus assembly protein FimT
MRRAPAAGLSLIEVLFALSLALAAAGAAVPAMLETARALRLRAAASYIAGYLQQARLQAVSRSASVGLRFRPAGDDWILGAFVDTNGNGLRNADIASGLDPGLDQETRFSTRCPSVRLARLAGVPDVNGATGGDAVRFGSSAIASFARDGSASSGSVYLTDGRTQIAVTVTPATGRVRLRRWDRRLSAWSQFR